MELTFGSAALAALCSSEEQLSECWGPGTGRTVGRRLLDLAAATAGTLDRLPEAEVAANGNGEIAIQFADAIVVRGVLEPANDGARGAHADPDQFMITSLTIRDTDGP
jgi:hypothetical protein